MVGGTAWSHAGPQHPGAAARQPSPGGLQRALGDCSAVSSPCRPSRCVTEPPNGRQAVGLHQAAAAAGSQAEGQPRAQELPLPRACPRAGPPRWRGATPAAGCPACVPLPAPAGRHTPQGSVPAAAAAWHFTSSKRCEHPHLAPSGGAPARAAAVHGPLLLAACHAVRTQTKSLNKQLKHSVTTRSCLPAGRSAAPAHAPNLDRPGWHACSRR